MRKYIVIVVAIAIATVVVRSRIDSKRQHTVAVSTAPDPAPAAQAESPVQPAPLHASKTQPVTVPLAQPPPRTTMQRIARGDTDIFKLSAEQVQAHLARNHTNAESLLAAFNVTSDKEYLREALRRYPGSPFVLASAIANNTVPDQRRDLINQLKQSAPDNPLANYWLARDYIRDGQPDLALKEFAEASTKSGFHDFSVERIQSMEEMYLGAGYSAAEAKALAMAGVQIPSMGQFRELGREMSKLERQYTDAGDAASAQSLAKVGLGFAANLTSAGANSLLGQIMGTTIEREFLGALDPNGVYDFVSQPIPDRIAQLQQQDKAIRDSAKFFTGWINTATDAQLISYFDRLKLYGESAALDWARTQRNNP